MPDPLLFSLQQMTIDLSLIQRNHHLAKTDQKENDTEHSLTVALLCWYIYERNKLDLDISKILKYAITHDFVERYAGDVNTFASQNERDMKVVKEQESFEKLSTEYSDFPGMISAMKEYELKQDEESLFVWTVDKMQGMIMGDMDDWRPYASLNIAYDEFLNKHTEHLKKIVSLLQGNFRKFARILQGNLLRPTFIAAKYVGERHQDIYA